MKMASVDVETRRSGN